MWCRHRITFAYATPTFVAGSFIIFSGRFLCYAPQPHARKVDAGVPRARRWVKPRVPFAPGWRRRGYWPGSLRALTKTLDGFVEFGYKPERHTTPGGAERAWQLAVLDEPVERRPSEAIAPHNLRHPQVQRLHLVRCGWTTILATALSARKFLV